MRDVTDEETPAPPAELLLPPTPALLQAALSGDPDVMRSAVTAQGACQAASTCPSQFASCSGWSPRSECDSSCGPGFCRCRPDDDSCVPGDLRGRVTFNAFRVCFDSAGHSCTEWQQSFFTFCGC
jgi:hypothetical protein